MFPLHFLHVLRDGVDEAPDLLHLHPKARRSRESPGATKQTGSGFRGRDGGKHPRQTASHLGLCTLKRVNAGTGLGSGTEHRPCPGPTTGCRGCHCPGSWTCQKTEMKVVPAPTCSKNSSMKRSRSTVTVTSSSSSLSLAYKGGVGVHVSRPPGNPWTLCRTFIQNRSSTPSHRDMLWTPQERPGDRRLFPADRTLGSFQHLLPALWAV